MAQFDGMNEQEQMQVLMSQLQDCNLRQSVMQYINQTVNSLDKDANSKALIETLARESVHNQKSTAMWKSRTKKSVAVGVVAVVLAITVQFLVNYFTNELSKESHVDQQGAMVSTDGKVVKTQMEEMKVGADGKLLSRNGDASVKTMPTLAKVALASSLPDATLMALEEITVHSDKGYTMQIKVHGFSRVPVLNSRCGNIVHFYTAWKGKVTLDSTDLSFDEATAAAFKNAGFSLATGGRRLAGKITVDGFAKALDDIRRNGKWNCADVPLPTFSLLGERKETTYDFCGLRVDKRSSCYSMYGGLKVGVTTMAGVFASSNSEISEALYVKSSASVMHSDLYRASFTEYPMHHGQQQVEVSDLQTGRTIRFQLESASKSRTHCKVEIDKEATKIDKLDSDWHFEYLGTNEEDGKVLRHFRLIQSTEMVQYLYGESSIGSLAAAADFWDEAETLEPRGMMFGNGISSTVFDSYRPRLSETEMAETLKARTGKNTTELISCSGVEESPDMPFADLSRDLRVDEAAYYESSLEASNVSQTVSETLWKYLRAAQDSYAVSDFCYERCTSEMEAVKKEFEQSGTGGCASGTISRALTCLQEINMCKESNFVMFQETRCEGSKEVEDEGSEQVQRTLVEEDEVEVDEAHFFANESLAMSRKLDSLGEMKKEAEKLIGQFDMDCPESKNGEVKKMREVHMVSKRGGGLVKVPTTWCVQWKIPYGCFKGFHLMIKWGLLAGKIGMAIRLKKCFDPVPFPGVCWPMSMTFCIGGDVFCGVAIATCPGVFFYMQGSAWMDFTLNVGLRAFGFYLSFEIAKIALGMRAGLKWDKHPHWCWWVWTNGWGRRRWWRRRRNARVCHWRWVCDKYIEGYAELTLFNRFQAGITFTYWVKQKRLDVKVKCQYRLFGDYWKTIPGTDKLIYQRWV